MSHDDLSHEKQYEKMDYYEGKDGQRPWDMIEAFDLNFNLGNVIKYVCRAGRKTKNPLEDLEKARVYIEREISRLSQRS